MDRHNLLPIVVDPAYRRHGHCIPKGSSRDFVLGTIIDSIDDFNLNSLRSIDKSVGVQFAKGAMRMYDLQQRHVGYSRYLFEIWGSEPVALEVDLDANGESWVLDGNHWITLVQWLEARLESELDLFQAGEQLTETVKRELWDKQWRLWNSNEKHFPLLKLPAEIRESIYEFAFGAKHSSTPFAYARLGGRGEHRHERAPLRTSTNLLYLNRQVHHEASHILFERTIFRLSCIDHIYTLEKSKLLIDRIRRLEIALSHEQFLSCFSRMADFYESQSKATTLFQRLKLKDLTIEIAALTTTTLVDTTVGPNGSWSLSEGIACQKRMADRILRAAYPWISGHPVTVKGAVKNWQKRQFEAKCAVKRKNFLAWARNMPLGWKAWSLADCHAFEREEGGGVWLDGRGAVVQENSVEDEKAFRDLVANSAPQHPNLLEECDCEISCSPLTWDPET